MTKLLALLLLTGCATPACPTPACPIEECYVCGAKEDIEYRCDEVWSKRIGECD
jgi:hypothetical protein